MKIAIPYEDGAIFQHFGHTAAFMIYTIEDGAVVDSQLLPSGGAGHGALAAVLGQDGVQALICGGIGGGARMALSEYGIAVCGGVSGDADEAAQAFAEGVLDFDPEAKCTHHDHGEGHTCGDHGEGHSCGDHGCGSHGCGGHTCH